MSFRLMHNVCPRIIRVNLFLLCVGVSIISCAKESEKAPTASQFGGEIEKLSFTATDAPAVAPVYRWDFSRENIVHTYDYRQEVMNKSDMGISEGQQDMVSQGSLLIKSQGDKTADLVLKDMKVKMTIDHGKGEPRTMEQQMPPMVVQGMKEDGSGSFADNSQNMFLKMLFPLPPKPIRIGESVDVPAQMPFNAMGSLLMIKGRSRITLTQFVKIENRTCAQLDVDIDISNLKIPEELEGEYWASVKGSSVFYFDVDKNVFVSGTIAVMMQLGIDAPMPKMNIPEGSNARLPERNKMSMSSDNLIQVTLKP